MCLATVSSRLLVLLLHIRLSCIKRSHRELRSSTFTTQFSVAELAAHLAGVPHETAQRDIIEFENPKDHHSPFEALGTFEDNPLAFEPGTHYQYS